MTSWDPGPSAGSTGYHTGVVKAWDPITLRNTVDVNGGLLTDLPMLGLAEAGTITVGSTVGIVTVGSSWAIIGRFVIPGTPEAASAIITAAATRMSSASVGAFESRGAAGFGDLTTSGPTISNVLVGASGKAIVIPSAYIKVTTSTAESRGGWMSYEVTGATSLSPAHNAALQHEAQASTGVVDTAVRASSLTVITGMTPGLHTFTAKYDQQGTLSAVGFSNRNLTVLPL